jgi:hypothetical protein
MKLKYRTTSIAIISIFTVFMMVLFFLLPKADFSENENRYLAVFPQLKVKNVLNGSYMSDLSSYLCDHFPFRNCFLPIKTEYEKNILAKAEINNIYRGRDGFYIEKYNKPKNTDKIINTLNSFDKSVDVPVSLMLVPTAVTVYKDKLPSYSESTAQTDEMNKIYESTSFNDINVLNMLLSLNDEDNLYYKLDHHWTTFSAYNAYRLFCQSMDITPQKESDFNIYEATNSFLGTIYSKVNDNTAHPDSIYIYGQDNNITVDYPDKGITTNTLYNNDYLLKKDKYSVFLDNLHPLVVVTNDDAESNEEIAIVKDSYANCFIPFLVKHYKKIHIFDTRYYKESVSNYINSNSIGQVLILYNMNTIDSDTGITGIY